MGGRGWGCRTAIFLTFRKSESACSEAQQLVLASIPWTPGNKLTLVSILSTFLFDPNPFSPPAGDPGPNPTKHDFPDFLTNTCKISYNFVKNESYQIFANICKHNLHSLFYKYSSKNWPKMIVKKLVLSNYID
jgi:hypothetical protein